jgi:putative transposase
MEQDMSGTYIQNYCHLIFSTKDRVKLIDKELQKPLYTYISGIIKHQDSFLYAINGMPDHIHILCSLPKNNSLAKFVQSIKMNSSKWIHENHPKHSHFSWQKGYGAFSVSPSKKKQVMSYIHNQYDHHSVKSFQDEFIEFLNAYEIPFNSKYIWK